MCIMCLKYRIILLIVIKNPWVILHIYIYVLLRGAAPYPAGARAPLRPFDIPTFKSNQIKSKQLFHINYSKVQHIHAITGVMWKGEG